MFNTSQKEEYIDYVLSFNSSEERLEQNRTQLVNFFNRLEEAEELIQKDIAMMNFSEMQTVLPVLFRRTIKYQTVVISNLRKYLSWCIENGYSLDSENRLLGVRPIDLNSTENYKFSMVKDEDQLEKYCEDFLQEWGNESVENMYRILFHVVFNGILFDEVIWIKDDQVDLENLTIFLSDRQIKISKLCAGWIKKYKNMNYYTSSLGERGTRNLPIVKKGYLLERTVASRESMKTSMPAYISKLFARLKAEKKSVVTLTLNSIWLSGVFYRMFVEECNSGKIICDEYIERYKGSNVVTYTPSISIEECRVEYTRWKNEFKLQ